MIPRDTADLSRDDRSNLVLTATTISSIRELESVREEWNVLANQFGRPLLRHEWFACCAQALLPEKHLRVVVVRNGGRLAAAAPLVLAGTALTPRLEIIGMSTLHEPSGFLFSDERSLQALLEAVIALDTPIVLQRLDSDSPIPRILKHALPWPGVVVTRAMAPSLSIPVTTPWTEYEAGLSSRITDNLRRTRKRSRSLGDTTVSILSPTEREVDAVLDEVIRIEGSGWKGTMGSAMATRTPLRDFFVAYSRRAAKEGILRVAFLRFGGRVAAVELAVEAYECWWQLKIGYSADFSRLYPGLQLTHETIRYAFEKPLRSYEFLGSAADWEQNWRPTARNYCVAVTYPRSLAGIRAFMSDAWQSSRRRFGARLARQ